MSFINVEIKARSIRVDEVRDWLLNHHAEFKGTDHQTDTYFNVSSGRLKLREGTIENNLIYYERIDQGGPKLSDCQLTTVNNPAVLKDMLERSIGIKVIVKKKREIYFIENVKFHIDEVPGLGNFVEIEASNLNKAVSREELLRQCNYYMRELEIAETDLVDRSYSDMLVAKLT